MDGDGETRQNQNASDDRGKPRHFDAAEEPPGQEASADGLAKHGKIDDIGPYVA